MTEAPKSKKNSIPKEEARKILRSIKQKVFELEKENNQKIYVYYSGEGWYKSGGNSAQILIHVVADKTDGRYNPRMNPDKDYNFTFPNGIISIRDLSKFREAMAVAGVKELKEEKPMGVYIKVFELPKKLSTNELRKILKIDEEKRGRLNEALSLATADPELAALIRSLQKVMFPMVKQMKAVERELVGSRILAANSQLYIEYRKWAKGMVSGKDGINIMTQLVDEMCGYMLIMMENDILSLGQISSYTFKLERIREVLKKRLKNS